MAVASHLPLAALYAVLALGIGAAAGWLRRRIPLPCLIAFTLLPVALFPESFLGALVTRRRRKR